MHPARTPVPESDVNFGALQTKGFVVVPGFLSPAELETFRADFHGQPVAQNKNYQLTDMSGAATEQMRRRVADVLRIVRETSDLKVDLPTGGQYFATGAKRGIYFPWHQDHESFFETQNHYDYLNFYIPIVKPRPDRSNLSIVPFDVLAAQSPRTFRRIVRGGATRFDRIGRRHIAMHDDGCTVHVVRGNLDQMAHTPMLQAGDLLLMRGDVIHKTEDTDTERVALSFRAVCSTTLVRRSRLVRGGLLKARMMANNPATYQRILGAFDESGRSELSFAELTARLHRVQVDTPKTREQFWRYLLMEKARAGALPQLLVSIVSLKSVNVVDRCAEVYGGLRRRVRIAAVLAAKGRQ